MFRAFDAARGEAIAIKMLRIQHPEAVYRFKREFRLRANVHHPNLATLHELFCQNDEWFFTMELVEGVDLLEYLRSNRDAPPCPERTRFVFRQLALAVAALHTAGILHRDLKPHNVLVTEQGRVVLLDFGFTTELTAETGEASTDLAGSPAYMSPEQVAGEALGEASDWYSFGVVLFEALTGRLPFLGSPLQQIRAKHEQDAPDAAMFAPWAGDLADLARDLLRRSSSVRPDARSILAAIDGNMERRTTMVAAPKRGAFVGRAAELVKLDAALEATRRRQSAAIVAIHGGAGVGKTRLAREFMAMVRRNHPDAIVIAGRCCENESLPYRAVDPLVDGLSRHLARRTGGQAEAFLPRDLHALSCLFPVFRTWAPASTRRHLSTDLPELRRRGIQALRDLLARLGAERPLVLCIDDVQSGDVDSAVILSEWLRRPNAPAALILLCFRRVGGGQPPLVDALASSLERLADVPPILDIALGQLDAGTPDVPSTAAELKSMPLPKAAGRRRPKAERDDEPAQGAGRSTR